MGGKGEKGYVVVRLNYTRYRVGVDHVGVDQVGGSVKGEGLGLNVGRGNIGEVRVGNTGRK